MKTHKEQMDELKKFDPITYYEMTSNPTGADYDGSGFDFITSIIIFGGIGIILWFVL